MYEINRYNVPEMVGMWKPNQCWVRRSHCTKKSGSFSGEGKHI